MSNLGLEGRAFELSYRRVVGRSRRERKLLPQRSEATPSLAWAPLVDSDFKYSERAIGQVQSNEWSGSTFVVSVSPPV